MTDSALDPIAHEIWDMKYRFKRADGTPIDETVDDTWTRVAKALAQPEASHKRGRWERAFHEAMSGYKFLPAGRIIAGAGTGRKVTLFNCFVMGTIEDDMSAIFNGLREAALTMQQGGGIGHDFSTLRPKGAAGERCRRRCLRPAQFHGCVGCHVPHHHVGRLAPWRHDGNHALRPP
jgi:ribonucleoside-diphosphate reductase alpha chain